MVARWKFLRLQCPSSKLVLHELDHVAVGDPDPTSQRSADHGHRMCRFQWSEELSPAFSLPWICTRERGHHGRHIAGTGEWVAAVQGHKGGAQPPPEVAVFG